MAESEQQQTVITTILSSLGSLLGAAQNTKSQKKAKQQAEEPTAEQEIDAALDKAKKAKKIKVVTEEDDLHRKNMIEIENRTSAERVRLEEEHEQIKQDVLNIEKRIQGSKKDQEKLLESLRKAEKEYQDDKAKVEALKELPAPKEEEKRKNEEKRLKTILAASEEELKEARKNLADKNAAIMQEQEKLSKKREQEEKINQGLAAINGELLNEKIRHNSKVEEIKNNNEMTGADADKIKSFTEHYTDKILHEVPDNMRAKAIVTLADASVSATANEFMDKIRNGDGFSPNTAPQRIEEDKIAGVAGSGDIIIRVRTNEEGKRVAVLNRGFIKDNQEGKKKEEEIKINDSGIIDLSGLPAGSNVKLMAYGEFDKPILLAGIERLNVNFSGPKPGREGSDTLQLHGTSPTKAFEILGDEDGITKTRLLAAGMAADNEISRREAKRIAHTLKGVKEANIETAKLEHENNVLMKELAYSHDFVAHRSNTPTVTSESSKVLGA